MRTKIILQNIVSAKNAINDYNHLQIVSRPDSTLRGHYPAETYAIFKVRH